MNLCAGTQQFPSSLQPFFLSVLLGTTGIAAAAEDAGAAADHAAERYAERDPAGFTAPRRPITRRDYVDFVRPLAAGFEAGPNRGQYGPRHALPALAVFALEGRPELGAGIKQTLRHYADWVDQCVREQNGVFSMEGATLCTFHFRELRKRGLMTDEDERWAKRLLLQLRQYHCAWAPGDGLWRGSHHRSQCQGINHALAAALYPDEPDVASWRKYAATVWADWWDFRDVGINDTGYFYSSLQNIVRAAELLERNEVFTDPESRKLFDRILFRITPNGVAVPYGSHAGYHGAAGAEIFILEAAAKHTRDGRYRWGAHRLMNFGQQRGFSNNQHHVQALSLEAVALASLVCDDAIEPVEPEGGSQLLTRKEIVRLTNEQARQQFPDFGGVDCNMFMTQRVLPHKLVFRAGWNPGDLYLLMEAYVRHDPLNPTAILACERHGVPFAEMCSEKFVSRENAVRIDDLSGAATYCGKKDFRGEKKLPLGYAGMESTVPVFQDHPLATHARLQVANYMGFEAAQEREVLFVKNRFVVVRDETTFADRFRARVGPIWNTQNVGQPRGEHWLNTWFTTHWFQTARLYETPPWDLLVYYAPQSDRRLTVSELGEAHTGPTHLWSTQYAWEGDVQPETRVQSVCVLLPHAPLRDASSLAQRIEVLRDEPGLAAVCVRGDDGCEVVVLNPDGAELTLTPVAGCPIATRARAAYVRIVNGRSAEAVALDGSPLRIGGQP